MTRKGYKGIVIIIKLAYGQSNYTRVQFISEYFQSLGLIQKSTDKEKVQQSHC